MNLKLLFSGICIASACVLIIALLNRVEVDARNKKTVVRPSDTATEKSREPEPGKLEILDPMEKDLGVCKPNASKKLTCEIRNVGGQSIRAWVESSTCQCTVGGSQEISIKPSQRVAIAMTWKTPSTGEFLHSGTIKTDSQDQPELKVVVRAKVGEPFAFEPPNISLGSFHADAEFEVPAKLFSSEDAVFTFRTHRIADIELGERIVCESEPARELAPGEFPNHPEAKWMMELKLKIKPRVPFGEFNTEVQFKNIGPYGLEVLPYPVSGKSLYPVSVVAGDNFEELKSLLSLGKHKAEDGLSKNFAIAIKEINGKRGNLSVASIEPASLKELLDIQIAPPSKSSSQDLFPVSLKIPPGSSAIELTGRYENDFGKVVFNTGLSANQQYTLFLKLKTE